MALTRFFFASFLLFLPLLVIASAGDYGYGPKPDVEKPKPTGDNYGYGPKPNLDTSKPQEKENLTPTPDLKQPKPAGDYGYNSNPDLQKLNPTGDYGYGSKPDLDQPKPEEIEKELPVGCEGIVLCKSGSKYVPIKGAVARITCLAVDEQGYQTAPFSTYSCDSDEKGYFFAPLSHLELNDNLKLTECKAYLENSPLESCNVPTDVNKGISGASLYSYRILLDNNMKLYSVGPFFYTEKPESTPTGY